MSSNVLAATCLVEGSKTGTGFLISGNRIVTCSHVVETKRPGDAMLVTFHRRAPAEAVLTTVVDRTQDVAVLQLRTPVPDIVPLRFGAAIEPAPWLGWGYPTLARGVAVPIQGTIEALDADDQQRVPSLILRARLLESGVGSSPHGFSGSPVVVGGVVVGMLKRIIPDRDFPNNAAFGLVYGARAQDFVPLLLSDETLTSLEPPLAPPPASAPADGFDVLVAASREDLPRANELVEALRKRQKKVLFTLVDIAAGSDFVGTITGALAKSRAAIVLFSATTSGPRYPEQIAKMIWEHRHGSHVLLPLLNDGGQLPEPWDELLPIDLRRRPITGPVLERLSYAIAGQPAPYDVVKADVEEVGRTQTPPTPVLAQAERLMAIGDFRRVVALLPEAATDLETRRMRARALSKAGDDDAAIEILTDLERESGLDGETGAILAGCYYRKFQRTGTELWRDEALERYRAAYAIAGDRYPGINLAALLLVTGATGEARTLATQLRDALSDGAAAPDHWTHATVGLAHLILDELEAAKKHYRRAVTMRPERIQDIATMRRSAREVLSASGRGPNALDALFPVPRPVTFVGHAIDLPGQERVRFPAQAAPDVRRAIRAFLDRIGPALGIASATFGGDTIFLEAVISRAGRTRVLLPCPQPRFLEQYVVQANQRYEARKLLEHKLTQVVVVDDPVDDADLWSDFAPRLKDIAADQATALDEKPLLLALWDGRPSFLKSVIDEWQQAGWENEIEILPLRDGRCQPPARASAG